MGTKKATEDNAMICSACGTGRVRRIAVPGRRMAYMQIPDLELPADVELPTCNACGEVYADSDADADALDAALERAFTEAVSAKAQTALSELVLRGHKQRDLERLLGLSAGYLSKLKSGKDVSPQLASCLMMLAGNSTRVPELEAGWQMRRQLQVRGMRKVSRKP